MIGGIFGSNLHSKSYKIKVSRPITKVNLSFLNWKICIENCTPYRYFSKTNKDKSISIIIDDYKNVLTFIQNVKKIFPDVILKVVTVYHHF
jgi:hypothetical protein